MELTPEQIMSMLGQQGPQKSEREQAQETLDGLQSANEQKEGMLLSDDASDDDHVKFLLSNVNRSLQAMDQQNEMQGQEIARKEVEWADLPVPEGEEQEFLKGATSEIVNRWKHGASLDKRHADQVRKGFQILLERAGVTLDSDSDDT